MKTKYLLYYNGNMDKTFYDSVLEANEKAKEIVIKDKIKVYIYLTHEIPYNKFIFYGTWYPTNNEPVIFIKK